MNWDAIGAIGEIVGALAVVVSIVYLSIQIRSNTQATKAQSGFDATHSWADITLDMSSRTEEELALFTGAMSVNADWESYRDIDRQRLVLLARSIFQRLEGQFFLYRHGYLDTDLWESRAAWAAATIRLPFYAKWWELEKQQRVFSSEFVGAIELTEPVDDVQMT